MRIDASKFDRSRSRRGSAVLVLMMLLSTMVLIVAMTTQTAIWLRSEIQLVEKRQVQRLQRQSAENASAPVPSQVPPGTP